MSYLALLNFRHHKGD